MTESEEEVKQLEETLSKVNYKPIVSPFKGYRTKSGEIISWKEFGKRWKIGMQNLTPKQRTQNDILSSWIVLLGFVLSIAALIFFNEELGMLTYGLIIIFIGNTYANGIKLFSLYGQLKVYTNMENMFKEQNKEEVKE